MNVFKSLEHLALWLAEYKKLVLTSEPKRLTRLRILLQCLASGDFNPAHCVPSFSKHSIFGGVVSHGVGIIARAEAEFQQLLTFDKPVELIAVRLGQALYRKPLRVGDVYQYTFEISNLEKVKNRWNFNCRIVCSVIQPCIRKVAEWNWTASYIEHDLSSECLNLLRPKSYAFNVLRYFVIEPLSLVGQCVGQIIAIALFAGLISSPFTLSWVPLELAKQGFDMTYWGAGP